MSPTDERWFDGHLDLASLEVRGRDMRRPLDELNAPPRVGKPEPPVGPNPPAAVTLDSLRRAGVERALATIFTAPRDATAWLGQGPETYPAGDPDAAHEAGARQLRVHQNWVHDADVSLGLFPDPEPTAGGAPEPPGRAFASTARVHSGRAVRLGILMENADPIRDPDELGWWVERGVVAVGMAWATPSRYAGGNTTDAGLTDTGRALADAIDALGVVHDASHLSDRALADLFDHARGPIIASHSNCRALLDPKHNPQYQRHLTDDAIRAIAGRGGVIGVNLVRNFVRYPLGERERPSIDDLCAHIGRIADLTGSADHVALGSDIDGGISADDLPEGLRSHADLHKVTAALAERGWSEPDLERFRRGNWERIFGGKATERQSGEATG